MGATRPANLFEELFIAITGLCLASAAASPLLRDNQRLRVSLAEVTAFAAATCRPGMGQAQVSKNCQVGHVSRSTFSPASWVRCCDILVRQTGHIACSGHAWRSWGWLHLHPFCGGWMVHIRGGHGLETLALLLLKCLQIMERLEEMFHVATTQAQLEQQEAQHAAWAADAVQQAASAPMLDEAEEEEEETEDDYEEWLLL